MVEHNYLNLDLFKMNHVTVINIDNEYDKNESLKT